MTTALAPRRATAVARPLTGYRPYWAKRFGPAPFLPMSRAEMDALGWDSCDVIVVTCDAYVDHPSFGMALVGRLLEAQGFRAGVIAQPDWHGPEPYQTLGRPRLFFGVTAGNMDSRCRLVRSSAISSPTADYGTTPACSAADPSSLPDCWPAWFCMRSGWD